MLGYIIAGILIGPMGFKLIDNSKGIFQLADLGIILLLFIVGLELSPARLKTLKKGILIEGGSQMVLTTSVFTLIGFVSGLDIVASVVVGLALSLSSTAFALSYLSENSQLTLSHGQTSLSILLFQDLLIVPILALIPLFGTNSNATEILSFSEIAINAGIFCSLGVFCFFIIKPAISLIKKAQDREIHLAAFLFLIIGMAIGMEKVGLSMAMGSFIAGVFLANSEIKKDIKRVTLPFKGILMGVFFMTLGMQFEIQFLANHMSQIIHLCLGIFVIKGAILFIIGRVRNGNSLSAFKLSLLTSQAGEFGVVVFGVALKFNIINQDLSKILVSSIIITMMIAPFIARLTEISSSPKKVQEEQKDEPTNVVPLNPPVVSEDKAA